LTSRTIRHIINFIGVRIPCSTHNSPEKSGTKIKLRYTFFVSEILELGMDVMIQRGVRQATALDRTPWMTASDSDVVLAH
jgi:hypothetical protein